MWSKAHCLSIPSFAAGDDPFSPFAHKAWYLVSTYFMARLDFSDPAAHKFLVIGLVYT